MSVPIDSSKYPEQEAEFTPMEVIQFVIMVTGAKVEMFEEPQIGFAS